MTTHVLKKVFEGDASAVKCLRFNDACLIFLQIHIKTSGHNFQIYDLSDYNRFTSPELEKYIEFSTEMITIDRQELHRPYLVKRIDVFTTNDWSVYKTWLIGDVYEIMVVMYNDTLAVQLKLEHF